jgi:hypothetical protein
MQSTDAEKQDVIVRWKLIQKYLKKNKRNPDEMVQDILDAQREMGTGDGESIPNGGRATSSAPSVNSADASTHESGSTRLVSRGSEWQLPPADAGFEGSLEAAESDELIRLPVQETSRGDAEEDATVERAIQANMSQLQPQRQEAAGHHSDQEALHRALLISEAEAQRHAREASEYEEELERVIAQSLKEQRRRDSDSDWDMGPGNDDGEDFGRAARRPGRMTGQEAVVAGRSTDVHLPQAPSYDPGHLAGTTKSEFEAQERGPHGEKSLEEKAEEAIVLEYVKKQSLLEQQHRARNKGKGRATSTETEEG